MLQKYSACVEHIYQKGSYPACLHFNYEVLTERPVNLMNTYLKINQVQEAMKKKIQFDR